MEAKLVWTSEPPTEPGWYWLRRRCFPDVVAEVEGPGKSSDPRARFLRIPHHHIISLMAAVNSFGPLSWSGPIPTPTEPDGGAE